MIPNHDTKYLLIMSSKQTALKSVVYTALCITHA